QVHDLECVLAAPQEGHQHAEGDQQLAYQDLALTLRRQGPQQSEEDRDVAERVEDQEQQQCRGDDRHGDVPGSRANGDQTWPRCAAPAGDSKVTQAWAACSGSTARVSCWST